MKKFGLAVLVLSALGGTLAFSSARKPPGQIQIHQEARNPFTHLRFADAPGDFQFAIVSDRTGGHRENIFSHAVEKLNLLQPSFVVSVGDLIEGNKNEKVIKASWDEFNSYVNRLQMPFFYLPGNHDVGKPETTQYWKENFGKLHYHFLYRDVLFLMLNSDDPAGSDGKIAKNQIAWAKKILADNAQVKWTLVFVHRPLWSIKNGNENGWKEIEQSLQGRKYSVFAGHVHRYQKFVRQGMNYYQFATTGGGSPLRGVEMGEFDHIVWVTMKEAGPILANLTLDSIHSENLKPPTIRESGIAKAKTVLHPFQGWAYFQGSPIPGAFVSFLPIKGKVGVRCVGKVHGDGSFTMTTHTKDDGAAAGEYEISITLKDEITKVSLLPAKYAKGETSGLKAMLKAGKNEVVLELKK